MKSSSTAIASSHASGRRTGTFGTPRFAGCGATSLRKPYDASSSTSLLWQNDDRAGRLRTASVVAFECIVGE